MLIISFILDILYNSLTLQQFPLFMSAFLLGLSDKYLSWREYVKGSFLALIFFHMHGWALAPLAFFLILGAYGRLLFHTIFVLPPIIEIAGITAITCFGLECPWTVFAILARIVMIIVLLQIRAVGR